MVMGELLDGLSARVFVMMVGDHWWYIYTVIL